MAKGRRKAKKGRVLPRRVGWLLGVLAVVAVSGLYAFERARHWRPDERAYPDQGALVGEGDGAIDFAALKGLGASFVYLEASHGAARQDSRFAGNLAAAREAGLQVGTVHEFDPCVAADGQSANFVTVVPRDGGLLPPAISMIRGAEDCPGRISDAAVQSELVTLVNQIEAHAGQPVLLAPGREFETTYRIARRVQRNLWLTRDFLKPAYAGRPWTLWQANPALQTEAAADPLRWVVVQP